MVCKEFEMFPRSISMFFGKTPKIKYICGKCDTINSTRFDFSLNLSFERPKHKCISCNEENIIPIELSN